MTEPTLKITHIKDRYHARLFLNQEVLDEMACALKEDISWICREMLRWYDKMGGVSKLAMAARRRQTPSPAGKVWTKLQLAEEKDAA